MVTKPDNVYGSYGSVADVQAGGGGSGGLSVRATPDEFGAQVGGALQSLGQAGTQVADKFSGMIAETQATNAETDYVTKLGALTGAYRSKEGLAAAAAYPQYQTDVADLRQQMLGSLPTGEAQRAFNLLALRHEGYALSDGATYSAGQVKQADKNSALASTQVAVSNSGSIDVAQDDNRFQNNLHDINFSTVRQMQNEGWDAGTGMKMDPKSGQVTFDDSEKGKQASAVYQEIMNKSTGQAWENRLHVLADQNVNTSFQKYQDNRANIPGETQAKLDAFFTPKIRDFQSRSLGDDVITQADTAYRAQTTVGTANGIDEAIHQQESGGKPHDYQIQSGTFAQYAKPGEVSTDPVAQDAVYGRIMDDLKKTYPNDSARQAVAYFSGKGNVAPEGSATPYINDNQDKNGKSVSSYVSDITNRLNATPGQPATGSAQYQSKADYYKSNYTELVSQAEQQAQALHPDDPTFAQLARARVETRLNDEIRQQSKAYKADTDLVQRAADGSLSKGNLPTSMDELANVTPEIKPTLNRLMVQQPEVYRALQTNITGRVNNMHGPNYFSVQERLFLPKDNVDSITDEAQLWPLVANHQITLKDQKDFADMLKKMSNPEGKQEQDLKKMALNNVLDSIVPKSMRTKAIYSAEQGAQLQNATMAFEQSDQEAIKNGKTAAQRYSTTSKDFVGSAAASFVPPPADKIAAALNNVPKYYDWLGTVPIPEEQRQQMALDSAQQSQKTTAPASGPKAGDVVKGYTFKGGNPSDKNNWTK